MRVLCDRHYNPRYYSTHYCPSTTWSTEPRYTAGRDLSTMPKVKQNKRNSAAKGNSYADAAAKTKAANNVFKMNTDVGQHVLKNPGIAQAIVDKAELKQSDVGSMGQHTYEE